MNLVNGSDRDACLCARANGLARARKIHGADSVGGRFIDAVGRDIDPAEFLEWSLFRGSPLPLSGRRCAGDLVVETQPIEERLLPLALAPPPNRESGETSRLSVRNRHCKQHAICAGIGGELQT